jgi:hypothetical protein
MLDVPQHTYFNASLTNVILRHQILASNVLQIVHISVGGDTGQTLVPANRSP